MTIHPALRRPLLAAVPAFLLLCALGTWQVQRLAWKTDLIARIAAAEAAPPAPFPAATPDPRALEYRRLELRGRFDHDREAFYGAIVRGRDGGSFVVTPLIRDNGPPVLVLRGWVKEGRRDFPRPEGAVAVTGFAFPASRGNMFTPAPDAAARRFFAFDIAAIAAAIGLPEVAPVGLAALGPATDDPRPEQALPKPANPHLGYAITWYGLALSLLAVFFVWARGLVRRAERTRA